MYISAPEGAVPYPGFHNLWSRDWIKDEVGDWELGEDKTAVRSWHSGAPLGFVPTGQLIGTADCVENGERWPLAVVPELVAGFDVRCGELVPPPHEFLSVLDPRNWCYWCERILQCYNDPVGLAARLAADFGVAPRGTVHTQTEDLPPQFVLLAPLMPAPWVFVCAGTVNALQWLAQISYGFSAPRDFGTYSSHFFWEGLAQVINGIMLDFTPDPAQPIILVGHSLGGAVCALIAAKLRQFAPNRSIQLLLSGCPRAGDRRLMDILATCNVVSLATEEDIICSCPFELIQLGFIIAELVGADVRDRRHDWTDTPNRVTVDSFGVRREGALAPGPPEAVLVLALWFINVGPPPDIDPHLPEEYVRRFCLVPQNVPAVMWGQAFAVIAADAPGFTPQELVGSTALVIAADAELKGTPSIVGDVGLVVQAAATMETGDDVIPAGMIMAFAGELAPTGWLACNGADYEEADYPELAAILPDVWRTFRGAEDPGDGFFRVPMMNGLAVVGVGTGAMNPTTDIRELGIVIGEQAHTLIASEMPIHSHTADQLQHRHAQAANTSFFGQHATAGTLQTLPAGTGAQLINGTTFVDPFISVGDAGGDAPHNNMQPSVPLLWCIKT